jgi:hypothetical protein
VPHDSFICVACLVHSCDMTCHTCHTSGSHTHARKHTHVHTHTHADGSRGGNVRQRCSRLPALCCWAAGPAFVISLYVSAPPQDTATHCNTLQHTARCCLQLQLQLNNLQQHQQHSAMHCNTQHFVVGQRGLHL